MSAPRPVFSGIFLLVEREKGVTLCLILDLIRNPAWISFVTGDIGVQILCEAHQSHTKDECGNAKFDKPIAHAFKIYPPRLNSRCSHINLLYQHYKRQPRVYGVNSRAWNWKSSAMCAVFFTGVWYSVAAPLAFLRLAPSLNSYFWNLAFCATSIFPSFLKVSRRGR